MATACDTCVFERSPAPGDVDLLDGLDRCGACPRLADPHVARLVDRLRRADGSRRDLERAHAATTASLRLLSAIASLANAATDTRGMLALCLQPLCDATGFDAAAVVLVDHLDAHLDAHLVDHLVVRAADPAAVAALFAELVGSVWLRGLAHAVAPAWQDADDELPDAARAAGVRRLLALPVLVDGDVAAVCVLAGAAAGRREDVEAIATAAQLALTAQLGRVIARQRAAEASARARETAEFASRAKSDFVASISHELRTPLSAILGYGELLAEEFTERGLREPMAIVNRMNGASRHLLGLINNVLDLSKIEAGKMEVIHEPVDVDELVDDVVETLTPMVEDRGTHLLRRGARVGRHLLSDPTKIRQILFNLIGNAAKFTKMGTITVGVAVTAEAERGEFLHLSVEDTGIGMNDAQLARIFEAFTQADVGTSARYGGTGLGLTLCRRFADLLGGTIHVTSKPNVGSRFSVELPAEFVHGRPRRRGLTQARRAVKPTRALSPYAETPGPRGACGTPRAS